MRAFLLTISIVLSSVACEKAIDIENHVNILEKGRGYILSNYGWDSTFEWKEGELFTLVVYESEVQSVSASQLKKAAIEVCELMYKTVPPLVSILKVVDNDKKI